MKNFISTFAIALAMLNAAKANHFSALNLKMSDNGNFSVLLDNFSSAQSNFFSVPQLQPGYHHLTVFRFVTCPYSYYPMKKTIFNGWISVPPKSILYAQIDCNSQFNVVKMEPYFFHGYGINSGYYEEGDDYGYGTNCGYEGNGWSPSPAPMPMCMQEMEFMQLKESIASKSFESTKLQMAKQALAQNYFTSAQVADLMNVFSFESSKLDFAECAYGRVLDKQNYYLVNNSFSFESSIGELSRFIAGK